MQSKIEYAFRQIDQKRKVPWKSEEEVRIAWVSAIEEATGLILNAERGKKDASLNHVIVEFKAPGLFKGKKESPKFKEAMENRLLSYVIEESKKTGIPESDFIGVAIDGEHVCFAQVIGNQIQSQQLIPFSLYAVNMVIDAFISDKRKALTSENLLGDFGHTSANARGLMQSLSNGLADEIQGMENNKIKMLFEEWRTLYGQVADMSVLQSEAVSKELSFDWSGKEEDSLSARLFVIHTYNSILIKLLAAEIVSSHGLTSFDFPAQTMSAIQSDDKLVESLEYEIERSKIFEGAGIRGFVEESIFSWYLDVAKQEKEQGKLLLNGLRKILSVLSFYSLRQLFHTRDVLRDLYQGLVPGKLRQSLGEFYTPDWLVDFTLSKANSGSWLDKKVLDPTCGSGAFLISLIRKKIYEAKQKGWDKSKILNHLCSNVWGFDLNPLAVQTARVNFLIEISDLMKSCPGVDIELPVLLADAIYSPAQNPKGNQKVVEYKVGSQVAKLDIVIPSELALNRDRLEDVFSKMSEYVESGLDFDRAMEALIKCGGVQTEEASEWSGPLSCTYNQILELHRKKWNGIWFKIVRNFFWSANAGEFDCVVGNPPWVRWSKLPDSYRERVKPTCEEYGIFSSTKRHGGNELDISAIITYSVSDKWLKDDGLLAFVITGTLFKNPSSSGFRTFKLNPSQSDSAFIQPLHLDDFKRLKPFENVTNHAVVAVFQKTRDSVRYPVPYTVWDVRPGHKKAISSSIAIEDLIKTIEPKRKEAFPVGENGSPWATLNEGRFNSIKYLSSECDWTQGRKGITSDLNGVYFVPILQHNETLVEVKSRPGAGRKDIGAEKKQWVEPDLLYPLIKGAGDFEACYLKLNNPDYREERLYAFLPNDGISKESYQNCEERLNSKGLKKTKSWFQGFESLLRARSTYRRQMKDAPYQAVYNVGDYTFKPWKVLWPEMSSGFYAAVAGSYDMPLNGERVFIPDHKIYFASFDDKESAYYLCGLLNAKTVREWLDSHNVSIQVANIFKHLSLPKFDSRETDHLELSCLVEKAHGVHDREARYKVLDEAFVVAEKILTKMSLEFVENKKQKS
ncbi:Eco57I restriction-modification methylase domain-containing protein [Dethiosulfovibrio salsuginis]|uniref:site-specific DNA-methyltransferase (adenine-specific) n=1 Tax=Dethiosulfovibrio salsuginis TaxID=561720 RepID=A0A1X7KIF5_9BACT|nr:N-6 DNA methylase [Dethiosulfovibrio salsuginis]SMG41165.1 N-6 DNA Methylase [Dethiosulfovibrio salsuginis]